MTDEISGCGCGSEEEKKDVDEYRPEEEKKDVDECCPEEKKNPDECSEEQVKECHGDVEEHPCETEGGDSDAG